MLSKPGGVSSAIIVWEKAKYGAWKSPKMTLYALHGGVLEGGCQGRSPKYRPEFPGIVEPKAQLSNVPGCETHIDLPKFRRPNTYHSPKRNQDSSDIGYDELE